MRKPSVCSIFDRKTRKDVGNMRIGIIGRRSQWRRLWGRDDGGRGGKGGGRSDKGYGIRGKEGGGRDKG